jgi:protoporphyrinogen oxidase
MFNYHDWLLVQYGHYFTNNFTEKYTLKYWGESSKNLGYKWVGTRMYKPRINEILKSLFFINKKNNYYIKEMRYPVKGGYKAFISTLAQNSNILYEHEVLKIDPIKKIVYFTNGTEIHYSNLLSSMPLPLLIQKTLYVSQDIRLLSDKLYTTSIALVSIGFNKVIEFPSIWFYVYDQDIPFARAYSPTLKSSENAPKGKSSLQCEIYFSRVNPLKFTKDELSRKVIESLIRMNLILSNDVMFTNVNFVPYANVVFYSGMEEDRNKLIAFISQYNIKSIGRFGEWDYLWSNQSFMSGYKAAKTINDKGE